MTTNLFSEHIPMFEDRAVAFLDILGFKEITKEAEATPQGELRLLSLLDVVGSHVKWDNQKLTVPALVKPEYTFISDSIIISAARDGEMGRYKGVISVVIKTIQIAQKLMLSGYLLRGGISVGKVRHKDRDVFGTAYIGAYLAEQAANYPRVILTDAAAQEWSTSAKDVPWLCLDDNGTWMVDVLCPHFFDPTGTSTYEGNYQQIKAWICSRLQEAHLGSPPRSKWEWMAGFFNEAVKRYNVNISLIEQLPFP